MSVAIRVGEEVLSGCWIQGSGKRWNGRAIWCQGPRRDQLGPLGSWTWERENSDGGLVRTSSSR